MYDAVIVGGGIVGTSVGYHLARAGADALLVDRADEGRATDAGAGIVSAATSSRSALDDWFRLGAEAAEYYPTLDERLREEQTGPTGYDRPGLVSVAFEGERPAFEDTLARIRDRTERLGRPAPGSVRELSPDETLDLVPALARPERAFHYADAGRVDGKPFTAALRRAGEAHGLSVARASAERLRIDDGRVTGVGTDAERFEADAVVIAGGAWSGAFADQLGVAVPVEPMRGQIAHLATDADTADWPIVSTFGDHYAVPWPDGRVAVGATREADAGFAPHPTADGVREVLDEALATAPGLADARLEEVRVGLRPATPDGLPILGAVPDVEGVHLATGHGPTGLTLGPYSGKLIADLVRGETAGMDLSPFGVERFEE